MEKQGNLWTRREKQGRLSTKQLIMQDTHKNRHVVWQGRLSTRQLAVRQVWCGLFPTDAAEYDSLRDALGKLKLNDAALAFEPENSLAMGFGFRSAHRHREPHHVPLLRLIKG